MAANPRDIIIRPIVTEKTSDMMKDKYRSVLIKLKSVKLLKPSSASKLKA